MHRLSSNKYFWNIMNNQTISRLVTQISRCVSQYCIKKWPLALHDSPVQLRNLVLFGKNIINSSKLLHILRAIQMILDIWILSRINTIISLYISFNGTGVEIISASLAWFVTKSCRESGVDVTFILPSSCW